MPRIACLWVEDLPLAAMLRGEPELCGQPVVIVNGRSPRDAVVAVSAEAAKTGIARGVSLEQARATCGRLVSRIHSAAAVADASDCLADVAGSVSPRVEVGEDGAIFLDCGGSGRLCASEGELATVLAARAKRQGFTVRVGIGSSKLVARIAAREGGGVRIVRRGDEQTYLSRLPIGLVAPDEVVAITLADWGIRRIGDLATLRPGAVVHRLGAAGACLVRRARGEDEEPLRCRSTPASFSETLQLEHSVEDFDRLLFRLRRLIDRMTGRVVLRGLACEQIEVRLDLEHGGRDVRRLAMAAPSSDGKVLLALVRAQFEQRPPVCGVTGMTVVGRPVGIRPVQLDLFRPSGPSPGAMAETVARLGVLCGSDRIGVVLRAATHRPGAVVFGSFPRGTMSACEQGSRAAHLAPSDGQSASARDSLASQGPSTTESAMGATPIVVRAALRAFRPPLGIEVFKNEGRFDYVRASKFGGRVVHFAGPWRLSGEWWTGDPYAREYYDIELSDGGLYRVYRDERTGKWLADGTYD